MEAIDFCKKCNIPTINIHFAKGNVVTLTSGKEYLFKHFQNEFHGNLLDFRKKCLDKIADYDIMIGIENTDVWDKHEIEAIELLLESPIFGLTIDIGHNHAVKDRDLDFFEKHKDKLIHMHGHDGWSNINHQALGSGEIDLIKRFNFAKSQNASVVLETKTIQALEDSVKWLKNNMEEL